MNAKQLVAYTGSPAQLLKNIKTAIDKGNVRTWAYDSDGDFTHTPEQWVNKAWLRPQAANGALVLNVIAPKSGLGPDVAGVYLGRFAEMLVNQFAAEVASTQLP